LRDNILISFKTSAHRPGSFRRLAALISIIQMAAILMWPSPPILAAQPIPQEYELKSVYLYNFLQFVNWPAGPCSTSGKRVEEIAVLGDSPIGESLKNLQAELKKTREVELSLRFYGPYVEGMDLSGCQLIFISQPELKHIKKIVASLKGKSALLVADDEDCLDQGCMIALLTQSSRIRWAINRRSIEASGFKMNARLLEMAVKVIQ